MHMELTINLKVFLGVIGKKRQSCFQNHLVTIISNHISTTRVQQSQVLHFLSQVKCLTVSLVAYKNMYFWMVKTLLALEMSQRY